MASKVVLSGPDIDTISFPFTMETITFGASFELREIRNIAFKTPKWKPEPISLEFSIVVGVEGSATDHTQLMTTCEQLVKSSIPERKSLIGSPLHLTVGNWFSSDGFVSNVLLEFKAPWTEAGDPKRVDITLEFTPLVYIPTSKGVTFRRIFRDDFSSFTRIKGS